MNNELNKGFFNTGKSLKSSMVTDPFKTENIDGVYISWRPSDKIWRKNPFEVTVYFENGNTKGEQKIVGDTLPEVLEKLQELCNSL